MFTRGFYRDNIVDKVGICENFTATSLFKREKKVLDQDSWDPQHTTYVYSLPDSMLLGDPMAKIYEVCSNSGKLIPLTAWMQNKGRRAWSFGAQWCRWSFMPKRREQPNWTIVDVAIEFVHTTFTPPAFWQRPLLRARGIVFTPSTHPLFEVPRGCKREKTVKLLLSSRSPCVNGHQSTEFKPNHQAAANREGMCLFLMDTNLL